jgi:hypothetical protein
MNASYCGFDFEIVPSFSDSQHMMHIILQVWKGNSPLMTMHPHYLMPTVTLKRNMIIHIVCVTANLRYQEVRKERSLLVQTALSCPLRHILQEGT